MCVCGFACVVLGTARRRAWRGDRFITCTSPFPPAPLSCVLSSWPLLPPSWFPVPGTYQAFVKVNTEQEISISHEQRLNVLQV